MIKLIIFRNGRKTVMCMSRPLAVVMASICMARGETGVFKKMKGVK